MNNGKFLFANFPVEMYFEIARHNLMAYKAMLGIPRFVRYLFAYPHLKYKLMDSFSRPKHYGFNIVYLSGNIIHRNEDDGPAWITQESEFYYSWPLSYSYTLEMYCKEDVLHRDKGPAFILRLLGRVYKEWWTTGKRKDIDYDGIEPELVDMFINGQLPLIQYGMIKYRLK